MTAAALVVFSAVVVAGPSANTPPPPPPPAAAHLPGPVNPFALALAYTYILTENGDLANGNLTTQAVGLHWTFPSSTYVRNHFEIGEQWESGGLYSARGLRVDLISFGYPIRLVSGELNFAIEPIVTPVRGEIMFVKGGGKLLRMEAGVGLAFLLTTRGWYLGLEPLHVDFRYWVYSSVDSRTGFSQIVPLRVAVGHEF
jgi:hypothetical protein